MTKQDENVHTEFENTIGHRRNLSMSPVSLRLQVLENKSIGDLALLSVTRKYPFSMKSENLNEETESYSCNVSTDETRHNRVSAPVITSAGNLKQSKLETMVRLDT